MKHGMNKMEKEFFDVKIFEIVFLGLVEEAMIVLAN